MHLLILGGSPEHLGGVEAFCDRSMEALRSRNSWTMERIPTGTAYLTLRRLPFVWRGLLSLIRQRRTKPDCVWLQYVNLPDLLYLVTAKVLGLKVMVTPHLGSNWRSQSNPILRNLSGWLLGFADQLALISKTQQLEIKLPQKVPRVFIKNFLPAAVLAGDASQAAKLSPAITLIHSGRLSAGKGTFLFVEVCQKLKAAKVPFFAKITGGADGETRAQLAGMIQAAGLDKEVAVLGRVPDDELLAHLRASDILLHLSRIDSYPLIVLEAMTCSALPICMPLAGARDMVDTYDGWVTSDLQPVDDAVSTLRKLDLADVRQRGILAGRRVREDYSWSNCAGALETAIRKVAAA